MYILDSSEKQIINTEFVERFCIIEKGDAASVVAIYSDSRPPLTIGRYLNGKEARKAIFQILNALHGGKIYFCMPESETV